MRISPQADALRRAAQAGDFPATERLSFLYADVVRASLPGLPPGEAAAYLHDACQTLEWSRRCLCAARSRIRDQLGRLHRSSAYQQTQDAAFTWRILG